MVHLYFVSIFSPLVSAFNDHILLRVLWYNYYCNSSKIKNGSWYLQNVHLQIGHAQFFFEKLSRSIRLLFSQDCAYVASENRSYNYTACIFFYHPK